MNLRPLGPSGPLVSAVGLGGMYLSITGRPDEAAAVRTIHAALDAGVTFIDSADVYCLDENDIGHNERLIARALAGRPERVTVATKGGLRRPAARGRATPGRSTSPPPARRASARSAWPPSISTSSTRPTRRSRSPTASARSPGCATRARSSASASPTSSADEIAEARADRADRQRAEPLEPAVTAAPEHDGVLAACTAAGIAFLPYSPFGGASGALRPGRPRAARRRGRAPGDVAAPPGAGVDAGEEPGGHPDPGGAARESTRDSAAAADVVLSAAGRGGDRGGVLRAAVTSFEAYPDARRKRRRRGAGSRPP